MSAMQMLASYGALGVICLWFMWQYSTVMKKLSETLNEFTVVFKVFIDNFDGVKRGK